MPHEGNVPVLNRNPVLVGFLILAASTWIGSFVCLVVVSSVARSTLDPAARVDFFRALGRRYGMLGGVALLAVIGIGLAMTWPTSAWSSGGDVLGALVLAAVALTAVGVQQARAMTRLRRRALGPSGSTDLETQVQRHARLAAILRTGIGLDTLAAVAVLAWIIGWWR